MTCQSVKMLAAWLPEFHTMVANIFSILNANFAPCIQTSFVQMHWPETSDNTEVHRSVQNFVSSVRNILQVTLLAPRIWSLLLNLLEDLWNTVNSFLIENRKSGNSRKILSTTWRITASWQSETWVLMNNFKTNFYIFLYGQGECTTSLQQLHSEML
jgi:hypothetical protein